MVYVRNDNHHKATTATAQSAGQVVVEMLYVAGMPMRRRLTPAIADALVGGILNILEHKCIWFGAGYVKSDPWFVSSRLCAHYDWKNDGLTLSEWE